MEDNLKELKQEYKNKRKEVNSFSEYHELKKDYNEMKNTLKEVNKIVKENDLLESFDDLMEKYDFQTFDDFQRDNPIDSYIDESTESENGDKKREVKYSNEEIDKLISDIDNRIDELDKNDKDNSINDNF